MIWSSWTLKKKRALCTIAVLSVPFLPSDENGMLAIHIIEAG